jgi:hypothetical protein
MDSSSWSVDPEGLEETYGVLRGLTDAGAPLQLLGTLLTAATSCPQRRWLIDNRMTDEPLALPDMAHFLDLVRLDGERLGDVMVAWVAPAPWDAPRQSMAEQLPFPFRRFAKLDEALCWLEAQSDW